MSVSHLCMLLANTAAHCFPETSSHSGPGLSMSVCVWVLQQGDQHDLVAGM